MPRPEPPFYLPEWFYDTVIGVKTRRTFDAGSATPRGTWEYDSNLTPNPSGIENEVVTTVTDPLGHVTKHYFSVDHEPLTPPPVEGWTLDEYGLPFTRGVTETVGPVGEKMTVYLSTEVFHKDDLVDPVDDAAIMGLL